MKKYKTDAGVECTEEECKLIDRLKKLAADWKSVRGNRLWLFSACGNLEVMMYGDSDSNPQPEYAENGCANPDNVVTTIKIPNDGGAW